MLIQELSKALGAMVAQMEDLHFAFPQNESQLPTLSQLRTGGKCQRMSTSYPRTSFH